MGCDINLYVEENSEGVWLSCDRWTHFSEDFFDIQYDDFFYRERDYKLFSHLAGVRNHWDIIPISPPKGLPKNVSLLVKKASDAWGADGHNHSWLTLGELLESKCIQENDEFYSDLIPMMAAFGWADDVRIVFWFDG